MVNTDLPVITRSRLVSDLSKLGLVSGDTVMLHASVKAVGWIVGGPDMVLRAILGVIGSNGNLRMAGETTRLAMHRTRPDTLPQP